MALKADTLNFKTQVVGPLIYLNLHNGGLGLEVDSLWAYGLGVADVKNPYTEILGFEPCKTLKPKPSREDWVES